LVRWHSAKRQVPIVSELQMGGPGMKPPVLWGRGLQPHVARQGLGVHRLRVPLEHRASIGGKAGPLPTPAERSRRRWLSSSIAEKVGPDSSSRRFCRGLLAGFLRAIDLFAECFRLGGLGECLHLRARAHTDGVPNLLQDHEHLGVFLLGQEV
jgi:hypothetical protein